MLHSGASRSGLVLAICGRCRRRERCTVAIARFVVRIAASHAKNCPLDLLVIRQLLCGNAMRSDAVIAADTNAAL